ncbi:(2Fe-2S)-binding protein [Streptomyces sp. 8L]|uniref:(2Fe-2S)-binding protein n=1 Tax=Streptomyces sp. 8L TaxID=2877242 RepID=UPI001CD3760C|nr:(2Fe-2S)-binding protein [Streptomyces sp. 8L]MCA1220817.1 (2Fe-2S)-binding protein [Streptomyces sp. 8L]
MRPTVPQSATGPESASGPHAATGPEAAALAALAACGPFFACTVHAPGSRPEAAWRSMAELVEEPSVLPGRALAVREYLAAGTGRPPEAVEARVAASVAHLGLVARVLSPLFARTALHGAPPVPALGELWWQPRLGGAFPLSLPAGTLSRGTPAPFGTSAREAAALVFERLVVPLTGAVAAAFSVSQRTLWGNVASAVNGAHTALTSAAPGEEDRIAEAAAAFLAHDALRDTYDGGLGRQPFRRRGCCLIYRAMATPGGDLTGAVCGDCVLGSR